MKKTWFSLIYLCLALIISSCTSVTPPQQNIKTTATPPSESGWQERLAALNRIQSWHLNGKIAVQTSKDSGSATVDWSQNHGRYYVSLYGPIGSNSMKLSGGPGGVTLVTSNGKTFKADSAEELLAKNWGFRLPVSNLNYWVRGMPVPDVNARTRFDGKNRLTTLNQQGWNIQYFDYARVRNVDLPKRIYMSSPSLKTKFVIYQWNIR